MAKQKTQQTTYELNEERNQAWHRQIMQTIRAIQEVMQEHWPNSSAFPPDENCYSLATRIMVIRDRKAAGKKDRRPKITALESSAKRFLKELEAERAAITSSEPPETLAWYQAEIDEIDGMKRSINTMLDKRKRPSRNYARDFSEGLVDIWQSIGIKATKSVGPNDPLCLAVHALFIKADLTYYDQDGAEKNYSEGQVSDMLRGRTGRARSGKTPGRAQNRQKRAPFEG